MATTRSRRTIALPTGTMARSGSAAVFLSAPGRGITVLAASMAMWIMTLISGTAIAELCRGGAKRRALNERHFAGRRCTIHGDAKLHGDAAESGCLAKTLRPVELPAI